MLPPRAPCTCGSLRKASRRVSQFYDTALALVDCDGAEDALRVLATADGHRFGPLLHRYELSNWVLYARAYAAAHEQRDPSVEEVDAALARGNGLEWLTEHWL